MVIKTGSESKASSFFKKYHPSILSSGKTSITFFWKTDWFQKKILFFTFDSLLKAESVVNFWIKLITGDSSNWEWVITKNHDLYNKGQWKTLSNTLEGMIWWRALAHFWQTRNVRCRLLNCPLIFWLIINKTIEIWTDKKNVQLFHHESTGSLPKPILCPQKAFQPNSSLNFRDWSGPSVESSLVFYERDKDTKHSNKCSTGSKRELSDHRRICRRKLKSYFNF